MTLCHKLIVGCLFLLSCGLSASEGNLLYVGLAENGWQIFDYDLDEGISTQLTYSPGDKRSPQWNPSIRKVTFRDALGHVMAYSEKGEHQKLTSFGGCSDYALADQEFPLYYTRLAVGNPQRQFIWRLNELDGEPELAYRPTKGSMRQVRLSPDGYWLVATHLWQRAEERLIAIPLDTSMSSRYLTAEKQVAVFPSWHPDSQRIVFTKQVSQDNYDLYQVDLDTRKSKLLLQTSEASELAPVVEKTGRFIYFEQHEKGQPVRLARLEIDSGQVISFDLPRPAREPFWYRRLP